jgi:hypothetical protein
MVFLDKSTSVGFALLNPPYELQLISSKFSPAVAARPMIARQGAGDRTVARAGDVADLVVVYWIFAPLPLHIGVWVRQIIHYGIQLWQF